VRENQKTDRERPARQQDGRPTIGLLINELVLPYESTVWPGVADVAQERDVNLICFAGGRLRSPYGFESQRNLLYDLVNAENIDGLVVMLGTLCHFIDLEETRNFCERYRPLPMVSIGRTLIEGIPGVTVNYHQGMRDLLVHLIEVHGYRRIAFIRGPEGHRGAEERYSTYTEVLVEYGLPLDFDFIAPGNFTRSGGVEAIHLLLDQRKADFEAVVAADDDTALGVLEALKARGIRVPDDVAVVGFDDIEEAKLYTSTNYSAAGNV